MVSKGSGRQGWGDRVREAGQAVETTGQAMTIDVGTTFEGTGFDRLGHSLRSARLLFRGSTTSVWAGPLSSPPIHAPGTKAR